MRGFTHVQEQYNNFKVLPEASTYLDVLVKKPDHTCTAHVMASTWSVPQINHMHVQLRLGPRPRHKLDDSQYQYPVQQLANILAPRSDGLSKAPT